MPSAVSPTVLVVAGPTASGKSALALALARRLGGEIVNADSMQVYREAPILTARPGAAETALAPHHLYGVRPAREPGDAAWWRGAARAAAAAALGRNSPPILCGGTGLYLHAFRHGLAAIPDPGPEARAEARGLLAAEGPAALHARLRAADPRTAERLRPNDGQRLARAWEVWRGTGVGLRAWQEHPPPDPAPYRFRSILLDPPRERLAAAIARRFDRMLEEGALAEVAALLEQAPSPALPLRRACGAPELAAHLRGEITLEEARQAACRATLRYAKRQATWFRGHAMAERGDTLLLRGEDDDPRTAERFLAALPP